MDSPMVGSIDCFWYRVGGSLLVFGFSSIRVCCGDAFGQLDHKKMRAHRGATHPAQPFVLSTPCSHAFFFFSHPLFT